MSPCHPIPVNVGLVNKNRNLNHMLIWIEWLDSNLSNPHIKGDTRCRGMKTGLCNHMTQQQFTSASNDAVQDQSPSANGGKFGLTVSAAARITKMLADEPDGSFFRVAVLGGGCSGFQYDFSIDATKQPDDCVFTAHDVEIVIDSMSLELVDTAELDYKQDLMGSYFAVNNPNATASCGCGTSFSV